MKWKLTSTCLVRLWNRRLVDIDVEPALSHHKIGRRLGYILRSLSTICNQYNFTVVIAINGPLLGFSSRSGDCELFFSTPRDQTRLLWNDNHQGPQLLQFEFKGKSLCQQRGFNHCFLEVQEHTVDCRQWVVDGELANKLAYLVKWDCYIESYKY